MPQPTRRLQAVAHAEKIASVQCLQTRDTELWNPGIMNPFYGSPKVNERQARQHNACKKSLSPRTGTKEVPTCNMECGSTCSAPDLKVRSTDVDHSKYVASLHQPAQDNGKWTDNGGAAKYNAREQGRQKREKGAGRALRLGRAGECKHV